MRRLRIASAIVIALMWASSGAEAQPSFAGKWKLNLAKSQLTGQTISIEKTASGLLHFDSQGFAYDFDLSGKDFPTPDGGTVAYREVNPTTWTATNKLNGKEISTIHVTLKGDTQTVVMKPAKTEGGPVEQTFVMNRVSGGPGFLGRWKSTEVKGTPTTLEIALEGANGITVRYPEFQIACKGACDGKDHPLTGAVATLKQTLAFEKSGTASIKLTTRINGKPYYIEVLTLSADGKTLTDEANPVAVKSPSKPSTSGNNHAGDEPSFERVQLGRRVD